MSDECKTLFPIVLIHGLGFRGRKHLNYWGAFQAHSKGGLDARYLIFASDMEDYVASLTTISTPHHGSKSLDRGISHCDEFDMRRNFLRKNGLTVKFRSLRSFTN